MSSSSSLSCSNNNTSSDISVSRLSSHLRRDLPFLESSVLNALTFTLPKLSASDSTSSIDDGCSSSASLTTHCVPSDEVLSQWLFYLSYKMPPTPWMAVWKQEDEEDPLFNDDKRALGPKRSSSSVYVDVLRVEKGSMTAWIEVLSQDENEAQSGEDMLHDRLSVSLLDLYPIRDESEPKSVIAAFESAGVALDVARFFFKHLWMPWDEWDDGSEDWASEHLKDRLSLIGRRMSDGPTDVVYTRWQRMAKEFREVREDLDEAKTSGDESVKVIELEFELQKIRNDVKCFENEVIRQQFHLLQEQRRLQLHPQEGKLACLVMSDDQNLEHLQALMEVMHQHLSPKDQIRFFSQASEAIKMCLSGDVLVLCQGEHCVDTLGPLQHRGVIIGAESGLTRLFCLNVGDRSQIEIVNVDLVSAD